MTTNRPLVAMVAGATVAAVLVGGLLGLRQRPGDETNVAAPLAAAIPRPKVPGTVAVNAAELRTGRDPQLLYVHGRTVRGGAGEPITVPGKDEIVAAGRIWDTTLTIQDSSVTGSSLVILDYDGKQVRRIKGVDSLVTSADRQYAAYASGGSSAPAGARSGGKVYFQGAGTGPSATLAQPRATDVQVLAVVDRLVYFRAQQKVEGPAQLFRWDVDSRHVRPVAKLKMPLSVSEDGTLAGDVPVQTDGGDCSAVVDLATARQLWRTCQYVPGGFSPTSAFMLGVPSGSHPLGYKQITALDAKTGKRLRGWTGPALREARAEDDTNVLLQWHDQADPRSRSALVRCAVDTGQCELATPLSPLPLLLGS